MQISPTPADLHAAAAILRRGSDPRQSFCTAAARLLRADTASLWEVREADGLRLTAATHDEAAEDFFPGGITARGNSASRALADGGRVFIPVVADHPDVDHDLAGRLGLCSLLAEPVASDQRQQGAIVLGWREHVESLSELAEGFVALMAAQAAMAIDRADLARRLAQQALSDPLTGLSNRRGLARTLEREMARARRGGTTLGFVVLDLDHFKAFNDLHGHQAGDRLLVRAARSWSARLREEDLLARYGGEEFVLLLPGCDEDLDVTRATVDRVREATPGGVTASAGLALWDHREPAHRLLERADRALYQAKASGRDLTCAAPA